MHSILKNILDHPLLIVYGDPSSFEEQVQRVRRELQDESLSLELDLQAAQRDSWPATLVEILAQLGEAVLRTIPEGAESMQLQVYKRLHLLQNLQRRIRDAAPDEQLVQCLEFAKLVVYPMLATMWQAAPSVTLSMLPGDVILRWGRELRNFLQESLLRHFPHGSVRIVVYVAQPEKPRAFFGSDEMHASKQIGFYCVDDA